jgi:hypothetical protein
MNTTRSKRTKQPPAPPDTVGRFRLVAYHKMHLCFFGAVFTSLRGIRREVERDEHGTYLTPPAAIVDVAALRVVDALALPPEHAVLLQQALDRLAEQGREAVCACPNCGRGAVITQPPYARVPHCMRCAWEDDLVRGALAQGDRERSAAERSA